MEEWIPGDLAQRLRRIGCNVEITNGIFKIILWQQAFDWFRETHKLSVHIDDFYTDSKLKYDFSISVLGSQEDNPQGCFDSYYEARQECLKELIKRKEDEGK